MDRTTVIRMYHPKKPISKELLFSKWMCYSSTYFNSLPATITSHTPSRVYHVYLNCKNTSKRRGIQRALTTFRESLHGKFHELFVTNDAKDMYLKITEDIAHWFGRCQSRVLSLHLHRKALANKGKHNTIGCKTINKDHIIYRSILTGIQKFFF
eukprot:915487_1